MLSTRVITIDEVSLEHEYEKTLQDLADDEYRGSGEDIKYYGFEIVTNKGSAKLEFRNSSNGYYGGNMTAFKEA